MYDAIDAQGVGATVMINGVTMAAVAADGYIGNGQYDTTSSGATSGYTTDYADDTIVSTNTGQGYLDANGNSFSMAHWILTRITRLRLLS
jgi:hypothetical protein